MKNGIWREFMLVNCENIYKYCGAELLLSDISFTVEDSDVIGLVGQNGCGKSTLLKIIMGDESFDRTPDGKGTLGIANKTTIGFLAQNSGLESNNTIKTEMKKPFTKILKAYDRMKELEKILGDADDKLHQQLSDEYAELSSYFEANDGYRIDVKISTVLNGMGFKDFDTERIIDNLSGGEKTRLAMAKLLLEEPDLLILDEPTNHLDLDTLAWLEDYLKSYKGAILIVSHDRYFLNRLCNKIFEIENKKLTIYKGNYSSYVIQKEMNLERQNKEYEIQQKEIAKLEEYIAKNKVRASTANMAKSRQHMLDKIERIEKPVNYIKPPKIKLEYDYEPTKDILTVEDCDLTVGEGADKKTLIDTLSFEVKRGEKVSIIGRNGIGKTSILKLVQGIIEHTKGSIEWANNVKTAYFEQENTSLDKKNTVIDEVHKLFPRMTDEQVRKVLGSVLLSGEDVFKTVSVLSGGERAKLMFAILTLQRGNVLILDEPTNHLDLMTKEVLEQALVEYEGTIILVSHDRYLLNKLSSRIIEVKENGVESFNGSYDDYREQKAKDLSFETENKEQKPKKQNSKQKQYRTKEQRAADTKRKQRIKELEAEIELLENEISLLEEEVSTPEIASDYELCARKCSELEEKKHILDERLEEWAELE